MIGVVTGASHDDEAVGDGGPAAVVGEDGAVTTGEEGTGTGTGSVTTGTTGALPSMTIVKVLVTVVPGVPVAPLAEKGVADTVWVPPINWAQRTYVGVGPLSPQKAYGATDSTLNFVLLP
jgi:hypothetical protein